MEGKISTHCFNIVAGMEKLADDIFTFRFNVSGFTSFKGTFLKLKSFASLYRKHY